jgi:hypothetical protein
MKNGKPNTTGQRLMSVLQRADPPDCPVFPLPNKKKSSLCNEAKNGLSGVEKQANPRKENQSKSL